MSTTFLDLLAEQVSSRAEQRSLSEVRAYIEGPDLDVRSMAIETREADDDEMTFEGLACPWDVEDSYGTTFRNGCFSALGPLTGRRFPLLDMHKSDRVLGTFEAWESEVGLMIRGIYDDTQAGRDAWTQARSGSKPNLSVGFVWRRTVEQQESDDWGNILVARLIETSQITLNMQAVPGAGMTAVRAALREQGEIEAAVEEMRAATPDQARAALLAMRARAWGA